MKLFGGSRTNASEYKTTVKNERLKSVGYQQLAALIASIMVKRHLKLCGGRMKKLLRIFIKEITSPTRSSA